MSKAISLLDSAARVLLAASFCAMLILICMEVFLRNWHGASLAWYDELGRLLLIWTTFLGAAVATRDRSHYLVDLLGVDGFGRWSTAMEFVGAMVIAGVGIVFLLEGLELLDLEADQHFAATGISLAWRDAALITGAGLTVLYALEEMAQVVRQFRKH